MKNIFTLFFLTLLLTFCTNNTLLSKESGWEQREGYKYQRLVVDSLTELQLSPIGDTIYTYHRNRVMMIWDSKTGKLLDSVVFSPRPSWFNFSKDGITAVISYGEQYSPEQRIQIYNLSQKRIILEQNLNLFKLFKFQSLLQGCTDVNHLFVPYYASTSIYNYVTDKNELFLDVFISGSGHFVSLYTDKATKEELSGYLGVMEIKNGSLIPKKQIHDRYVLDYEFYNDHLLVFTSFYYKITRITENLNDRIIEQSNTVSRYDFENNSSIDLISLDNYNDLYAIPFITKVIPTKLKDTFLISGGNSCYYLNINATPKTVIDQPKITFPKLNNSDETIYNVYKNKENLVFQNSYEERVFYFIMLKSNELVDSAISPIEARGFKVINSDKELLGYNLQGEMVLLNIDEANSVNESTSSSGPNNIIYPNPTSGIALLNKEGFHQGQLQIDITDISGKQAKTLYNKLYNQEELQFDISDMPNGMYIIKAMQNGTIQSFKVIKGE